jgi:hypothetical protein
MGKDQREESDSEFDEFFIGYSGTMRPVILASSRSLWRKNSSLVGTLGGGVAKHVLNQGKEGKPESAKRRDSLVSIALSNSFCTELWRLLGGVGVFEELFSLGWEGEPYGARCISKSRR